MDDLSEVEIENRVLKAEVFSLKEKVKEEQEARIKAEAAVTALLAQLKETEHG